MSNDKDVFGIWLGPHALPANERLSEQGLELMRAFLALTSDEDREAVIRYAKQLGLQEPRVSS